MNSILIIVPEDETASALVPTLKEAGYYPAIVSSLESALELAEQRKPDAVLFALGDTQKEQLKEFVGALKQAAPSVVVLGLLSPEQLEDYDFTLGMEDFVVSPLNVLEVATRLKQLLWRNRGWDSDQIIKAADLVIDLSKYDVSLAGKRIELTFKEYELLRFLASNPGKVLTREVLLNQVWGYDYFGGTRTVDVHIRRLRSKIEDSTHMFVDTVRNVGYRFRE